MNARAAWAALGVAFGLALAGCGGSDDGRQGARETAERYVQALVDGDGEAACEQLSAPAVAEIEDRAGDRPCADALGVLLGALGSSGQELEDLSVTEVNVAGDVATATIDTPRGPVVSELELQDGEWKLASPGGR